jgi:glycosyltransferase involved in cell wall biosynthesis
MTAGVSMLFFVFSYNRGQFLENCVRSIEQCAPGGRVVVFDDCSPDASTVAALERIATRHRVLRGAPESTHRLGGLYGNMQAALELGRNERLVCFLQDDMQVVRTVTAADVDGVLQRFAHNKDLAFVQPCFLKGCNRARDAATMRYDPALQLYFQSETGQRAGRHFSAVTITQPARLLERGWTFARSEPENDLQASRLFGLQGHLFAPFAMWLPEVPAYRGRRKTWALRYAEKRRKCGFYPFARMTQAQEAVLLTRSPDALPVAEDMLSCIDATPPAPWRYHPLQGSRTLRRLNTLELLLRRRG